MKDHGEEEIRGWGYRPLGKRWTDAIRAGQVWVVEANHQVAGHAFIRTFTENGKPKAHIQGPYLLPEVLGQGPGMEMARLMIEATIQTGVKRITLESTLTAHEFYKHMGFRDTGPMERHDIGVYPVRCFPMAMSIDP